MSDALEKVRHLVQRLKELDVERAAIEAELAEIKRLASEPSAGAIQRKGTRTRTVNRARPLRKGSAASWAETAIRHAGGPVYIDDLVEAIRSMSGITVQKTSLVSNLSKYVRSGVVFSRPTEGFYSLIEFDREHSASEAP